MNSMGVPFLEKLNLPPKNSHIVVGLSGGADSVCLLHVLYTLQDAMQYTLLAAHVHHGIRGKEADRDEQFCKEFCKAIEIPLKVLHADIPKLANETGESEELCGRKVRYAYFQKLAGTSSCIATAHNLEDNAETVLLNLVRGTGLRGLCGIPSNRKHIYRPLLSVSRAEIELYCHENQLQFVTDSTNLGLDYSRNKIRNSVMPILKDINSNVVENIERFSQIATEDENALQAETDLFVKTHFLENGILEKELLALPPALRKRVYRTVLETMTEKDVLSVHLEDIDTLLNTGKQIVGVDSILIRSRAKRLEFLKNIENAEKFSLPFDLQADEIFYPYGKLKILKFSKKDLQNLNKELLDNAIDCAKINNVLFLRSREDSDRFESARGYSKSLKKLMNEAKIPPEQRNSIPILSCGTDIVWMLGFGTSKSYRVDEKTETILILKELD